MLTIIVTKWCNRQPLIIHSSLFICIAPSIDLFHCVCIDYEADIAGYTIISTAGKNRGLPFCTSLYIIYISFINYCLYRRLLFMFHNNPLNKLIHRLRYQPSSMNACVHVLEIWRPTPGSSPLSRYAGTISLYIYASEPKQAERPKSFLIFIQPPLSQTTSMVTLVIRVLLRW